MSLLRKRTSPAEGTGPAPKDTLDAGADLIITPNAPDPFCGRCDGPSGPEGAWCDNCIHECKEYTQQLDLRRFPELNREPFEWAAVFYARVGIPVFPLMPGKKVPATKHGKDDATTDLRVIRSWWRDHPNHNIGLVCGAAFDVLDVDIKDGRPGYESMARLRIAGHLLGAWGSAITPTGGRHLLYMPSGEGRASGLDFRGAGSYIAAAPSRTEHGTYQWEFCDPDARGRPFNWSAAMEHLHGPAPRPEHKVASTSGDIGGLVGFLSLAQPGERNHSLYWTACRAAEKGLPTDELLTTAIQIGLPEREAARTIQSAHKTAGQPV
jgi:hypothetical protein